METLGTVCEDVSQMIGAGAGRVCVPLGRGVYPAAFFGGGDGEYVAESSKEETNQKA